MKNKALQLFVKHKKWFYFAAVFILILLICLMYHSCKKEEKKEPEIHVPIYSFDTSFETRKQADNDLKKQGIIIKDRPYQIVTKTEAEGDKIAEDFAAENHADYVIKEKNDKPQIIENKDKNRAENKPEETKIYTNNYYAVSQEKKHDIKAGIAVIDDKANAVLTYRNRDVSYSLYTDGNKDKIIKGAAVQVTLAKW